MTIERQDIIADFYSGNTKDLRDTVVKADGNPKDLTDAEITFVLFKEERGDTIILLKSSIYGEITISNAVGGILTVHFLPHDTLTLYGTFRYQINVTDADEKTETVTTGRINIIRGHANRYRMNDISCYIEGL